MALFATPSAGVSPLVLIIACLPFALGGLLATLHSFGQPSRASVRTFLALMTLLLVVPLLGLGPAERVCKASIYFFGVGDSNAALCGAGVIVALTLSWLGLGVALCMYLFKLRRG